MASRKTKLNLGELKIEGEDYSRLLKQEFELYFPDLSDTELSKLKMTRNPFYLNKDILSKDLQKEFSEMKCNSTAKNNFEVISLADFWKKYVNIYKSVDAVAIRTLYPPFINLYGRKWLFFLDIKTKHKNKLDSEAGQP